jgi:hypothetical protein
MNSDTQEVACNTHRKWNVLVTAFLEVCFFCVDTSLKLMVKPAFATVQECLLRTQLKAFQKQQAGRSRVRFPIVSMEFFIDIILPVALWPWVDSACNRNDYQEYFLGGKGGRCVGLTTVPSSCADCLEIWELQPPGNLSAFPGL